MEERQLPSKQGKHTHTTNTRHTNPQRKSQRMSSPLVTGGCFALKSKLNDRYLRYSPEKGKILEVSGEDVLNPYTRFCAEMSREHDGHVHIRCCYNNKYLVAREVNNEWCLMGDANEPQEDLADPSCTLLRHEPSSVEVDNVKLEHASLKRSVYMLADAHPTEKTLTLLLGKKDKPAYEDDAYMFSVLDLRGQRVLPKYVCFKGDNGRYLSAYKKGPFNYLQFSSDDIGDLKVRNVTHSNSNGTIRFYSTSFGMFWKRSPNWIRADSNDTTSSNPDTVFQAILIGDGPVCALKNLGNKHFCTRLTTDGNESCLNAESPTINKWARLELHEAVLYRRIYDVEYRLDDVNIDSLKPRTFYSKTIDNTTDRPQKSKLTIAYDVTTETRWDSSVSLKLGVTTTVKAGVPLLAEASVEFSAEFSGSYTWGETKSQTEHYSSEEEVEVAAHTELTLSVVATEGTCDIPFSYTQEDLLTTGETIVTKMDDGIYRGVNSYGFKTVISEKKI